MQILNKTVGKGTRLTEHWRISEKCFRGFQNGNFYHSRDTRCGVIRPVPFYPFWKLHRKSRRPFFSIFPLKILHWQNRYLEDCDKFVNAVAAQWNPNFVSFLFPSCFIAAIESFKSKLYRSLSATAFSPNVKLIFRLI